MAWALAGEPTRGGLGGTGGLQALAATRQQATATLLAPTGSLEALLAARIGKRSAFDRWDADDLSKLAAHCPSRREVRVPTR